MWGAIVRSLRHVILYADIEELDRFEPIRDEADLDADDFVRLMLAVGGETGIAIPEADYPLVATLAALEDYLNDHVPGTLDRT